MGSYAKWMCTGLFQRLALPITYFTDYASAVTAVSDCEKWRKNEYSARKVVDEMSAAFDHGDSEKFVATVSMLFVTKNITEEEKPCLMIS
ncbi:hypothetical protein AB1K62_10860 [Parasphingorhabdus sp. JC815]|uniref:hypothetical protein n=1 Tax=Parasphingorhabdus sp. JC815 TaxID=3232140 RepID=UPI0034578661